MLRSIGEVQRQDSGLLKLEASLFRLSGRLAFASWMSETLT